MACPVDPTSPTGAPAASAAPGHDRGLQIAQVAVDVHGAALQLDREADPAAARGVRVGVEDHGVGKGEEGSALWCRDVGGRIVVVRVRDGDFVGPAPDREDVLAARERAAERGGGRCRDGGCGEVAFQRLEPGHGGSQIGLASLDAPAVAALLPLEAA